MSKVAPAEKIYDEKEYDEIVKEYEIIKWSTQYMDKKRQDPNYKPPSKISEFEIIDWCENFLKSRGKKV
jgi:hypothetical protein